MPQTAGTLTFSTSGYLLSGNVLTLGGSSLTINLNAATAAISSALAGTGALQINAAGGVLTFGNSNNTYSGATTIAGGTLSVGNIVVTSGSSGLGNATSAVTLSGGGDLSYSGGSVTYLRGFTIGTGGGEFDVTTGATTVTTTNTIALTSGGMTFGGNGSTIISTGATVPFTGTGTLTKTGTGTLTLQTTTVRSTAAAMPIVISGGTLVSSVTTNTGLTGPGPLGTGTITLNPTTGGITVFEQSEAGATDNFGNAININNTSGTTQIFNTSGIMTYSGSVTFQAGSNTPTLQLNNNNNTANSYSYFTGGFSGPGNITFNGYGNGSPLNVTTTAINNAGTISNLSSNASGIVTISAGRCRRHRHHRERHRAAGPLGQQLGVRGHDDRRQRHVGCQQRHRVGFGHFGDQRRLH